MRLNHLPSHRRAFLREGNEGGGSPGEPDGQEQEKGEPDPSEQSAAPFPANTRVEDMTAEQQAAYWKHYSRKHEDTAKARGDYDALKAKAAKWDTHEHDQLSVNDKAVAEARQAGRAEAAREANTTAGKTILLAGLIARGKSAEEATRLAAHFDLAGLITDAGLDTDGIASLVDGIAGPVRDNGSDKERKWPNTGQGTRERAPASGVAAGRDMFAATRTNQTKT